MVGGYQQSEPEFVMAADLHSLGVQPNGCNCMDSKEHVSTGMCKRILGSTQSCNPVLPHVLMPFEISDFADTSEISRARTVIY